MLKILKIVCVGGGKYYLFIGRIEKIKGMDILLQAFAKLQDKQLIIAGTGTQIEEYKSKASSNVSFVGFLERATLAETTRKAEAVIVPSQWYETFGMIIVEAYATRTPVIVGDIGNIASLVDDYKTGLKSKYDSSEALVDAIERIEKLDEVEMSENAYNKYKTEFAPTSNYEKLMEIYNSVKR